MSKFGVLGAIASALSLGTVLTSPSENERQAKSHGNRSSHEPHQGKKEMARRLKQLEKEKKS